MFIQWGDIIMKQRCWLSAAAQSYMMNMEMFRKVVNYSD